jgi:hypothetical protein
VAIFRLGRLVTVIQSDDDAIVILQDQDEPGVWETLVLVLA